jgi:type VI secretion system protein ImpF
MRAKPMAELTPQERLQPSLLDRLTDDEPGNLKESRDRRVLSMRRLRECVLRDLAWLLNTGNMEQFENLDAWPEAKRSVLNYGAPDLSGGYFSSIDLPRIERALQRAIVDFEPRLLAKSVAVRAVVDESKWNKNSVTFEIEAMLWSQPIPQRLFLRTDVDLETGHATVAELT